MCVICRQRAEPDRRPSFKPARRYLSGTTTVLEGGGLGLLLEKLMQADRSKGRSSTAARRMVVYP